MVGRDRLLSGVYGVGICRRARSNDGLRMRYWSLWMMRGKEKVVDADGSSFIYARGSRSSGRVCHQEHTEGTANQATHACPARPGPGQDTPGAASEDRGSPPWLLDGLTVIGRQVATGGKGMVRRSCLRACRGCGSRRSGRACKSDGRATKEADRMGRALGGHVAPQPTAPKHLISTSLTSLLASFPVVVSLAVHPAAHVFSRHSHGVVERTG
ncbi:hypothetical protein F5X68DRAFT_9283 [Plectosphaerella plurivora]|uniref:Uncharacterized protein n=1 Tax=Plectosphaerella plurivora TaxID=936078 RepID=A0A9P8VB20_9PEZI|nr:hypothetical protein F5X68DRAFT_9283 [Plectosphaerella plurivora]